MIHKIIYNLRFPMKTTLNKSLQYILISGFYRNIKEKLCIKEDKNCIDCVLKKNCIYHFVSGESFTNYPGILIHKKFYEKRLFQANESVKVVFYLVGNCELYRNLIQEYMLDTIKIGNSYIQKVRISDEKLDCGVHYTGKVRFVTPIKNLDEIKEMIKYYNYQYHTNFYDEIEITPLDEKFLYDETNYRIADITIKLFGNSGTYYVNNYPLALLEVGIGKENILGGGHAICEYE